MRTNFTRSLLSICALLPTISLSSTAQAQPATMGRLIIQRSASFGTNTVMQVFVDGQQLGSIGIGHRYDAPIAPGRHILAINYVPNTRHLPLTPIELTARPGQTYRFVGSWTADQRVVLRPAGVLR